MNNKLCRARRVPWVDVIAPESKVAKQYTESLKSARRRAFAVIEADTKN
jgi:hypothetical protein